MAEAETVAPGDAHRIDAAGTISAAPPHLPVHRLSCDNCGNPHPHASRAVDAEEDT